MKTDIDRFVRAHGGAYPQALKELKQGRKNSHWMWYIFPQVDGLGYSYFAEKYAIKSLDEAKEYFNTPILKEHYYELCGILKELPINCAQDVFPIPDDLKFCSSLTLFYLLTNEPLFKQLLDKYFKGKMCEYTVNKVEKWKKDA